uniref:Toxin n=1 Tax=Elaeophora elaphi TaxID=1147741 RepID=A0A0R3S5S0_9BILA
MYRRYFYFLTICITLLVKAEEKSELKKIFGYIFKHPKECKYSNSGDPFENDKEWIPAHRLCTTKCDIRADICMKSVKSNKQRCQKCLHFF